MFHSSPARYLNNFSLELAKKEKKKEPLYRILSL
jgi:hypothetical protein